MTSPWMVRLGPVAEPRVRVVCLPQCGGGTTAFRPLAAELPQDIELFALRLPGRETRRREPSVRRMVEVVDTLLTELDPYQDLPLALFGYCAGAYPVFELARAMVSSGRPAPARLFICGACGPVCINRDLAVHQMPLPQLKTYLNSFGMMPSTIIDDPALFGMFEPAIRADYEVFETSPFIPVKLDVPITAIAARDDTGVTLDQVLEWGEFTSDRFTFRVLPGGHDFLTVNVGMVGAATVCDLIEDGLIGPATAGSGDHG